jgi:hypothetical protein
MSYLSAPRLHFAGTFTTDVSTVNNIPAHFQNPNVPDIPGWNPGGSGSWGIRNVSVTSAMFADGHVAETPADDPVVGRPLAQSGNARLVDLDPQQQLASQIWALRLALGSTTATRAFTGAFKVTPFASIWRQRARAVDAGDFAMSAFFQSQLTGVEWADPLDSPFLAELRQASAEGILSIKFNLDDFNALTKTGRIVGAIGPATIEEPVHFVVGRQCQPIGASRAVWYFPAIVDAARGKLIADFGNSLQTTVSGGPFDQALDLQIGALDNASQQVASLGRVPIGGPGWYELTAGICEFPADRPLSAEELDRLDATPIAVQEGTAIVAAEGSDGLHVRADDFVYRMSASDKVDLTLRASRFGKPLPEAEIAVIGDPSGLQGAGLATPEAGVSFPATVTTDAAGIATLTISAGSIQKPRGVIDGQLYGVRCRLQQSDPDTGGYFNEADFISVLLWTDYQIPDEPTWWDHVEPILKQYKDLYRVMLNFVDLGDYDSVVNMKSTMQAVLTRSQDDSRYMPVTRDLSPAKRQMILNWLETKGNAGLPNLGAPPVEPLVLAAAIAAAPAEEKAAALGAKTAAFMRRDGQIA